MIQDRKKSGFPAGLQLALAFIGVAPLALPAQAATDVARDVWPVLLRRDLARVGHVEWRLRRAAGAACPVQAPDVGVVLDDRGAYQKRDWPLLAATVKMDEHPVVASVAPGSPADRAGVRAGDEVLALDGVSAETIIARRPAGTVVADALLDEIARTAPDKAVVFDLRRAGAVLQFSVVPVRHCAVRLVLFTDRSIEAHSDTRNVAISTGMLAFARTDDELALAAGHEIAHVINGDRRGAPAKVRRGMEDAADALGLRLMECAGYARATGITLFERLGSRDWLGFLRARTHRSWKARTQSLQVLPPPAVCPIAVR